MEIGMAEVLAVLMSVVGSYLLNWAQQIRFQAEVKTQQKSEQEKVANLEKKMEAFGQGRLQDVDTFAKELHKISLTLAEITTELKHLKERI